MPSESTLKNVLGLKPARPPLQPATVEEAAALPAGTVLQPSLIPAHYDKPVTPWDLQAHMDSTGSAFADARLADVIEYVFRTKGDRLVKLEDLRKAQHCLAAAIDNLEERFNA